MSGKAGSGAVFFSHCPLRCVYCQNAVIAQGGAGQAIGTDRLADVCLELQAQGALNINFVTPTQYSLQVKDAVERARGQGLHVPIVWNTSGYERPETIEALEGTVDVYLADFKYSDMKLAKAYSNAPDYPQVALAAIAKMVELVGAPQYDEVDGMARMTRGVIVRHLLLPGALENSVGAVGLLWENFGDSIEYSIMNQYTPVLRGHPVLSAPASQRDYERLLDFADAMGLEDYYWQDGPAAQESFIPAWDGAGLR